MLRFSYQIAGISAIMAVCNVHAHVTAHCSSLDWCHDGAGMTMTMPTLLTSRLHRRKRSC